MSACSQQRKFAPAALHIDQRDPGVQTEAKPARSQVRLELVFLPRPSLPEQPHVGIRGIGPSPPAQPVIGCVQHVIGGKLRQDHYDTQGSPPGPRPTYG